MMNWKDRKLRRRARELLHGSRKWLRINRDLLSPAQIQSIATTANELERTLAEGRVPEAVSRADELEQKIQDAFPSERYPSVRENVEVLLLAAIVAMAVRTFFVQPFKIPTGSMQPTLYGIVPADDCDPKAALPRRIRDAALAGKWPQFPDASLPVTAVNFFNWVAFAHWPAGARCVFSGDHIFVDKISYHFRRPRRGEVVVFDTAHVPNPRGKFYIKRLIGVEHDVVQIRPPHVLIDGQVLNDRPAFRRIYSMRDGYSGYVIPEVFPPAQFLGRAGDSYTVREDHLLVMGDNSRSSYDGRFWGDFPRTDLVGRAVLVYWPFSERFGQVD